MYEPTDHPVEGHGNLTVTRLKVFGREYDEAWRDRWNLIRALERVAWACALLRLALREDSDVVFCNYSWAGFFIVWLVPRLRRKLVMYSMAGFQEESHSWMDRVRLYVEAQVGRRASVTVAENIIAERCLGKAGIPRGKLITLEPGVDVSLWSPRMMLPSAKSSPGSGSQIRILCASRIVPRKGIGFLIKAAEILVHKKSWHNLSFLIVGPPTEGVRPTRADLLYVANLNALVDSLQLRSWVEILAKWQSADSLFQKYAMADIYVLPTLKDMAPHSIKQAMAMGKPILTTRVGWIRTLVEDGKNGLIVEPRNENALANALESLLKNESLRSVMGLHSRLQVEERWRMDVQLRKWEALLVRTHRASGAVVS